jgi:polar amino acid transport system substrate-binding protein
MAKGGRARSGSSSGLLAGSPWPDAARAAIVARAKHQEDGTMRISLTSAGIGLAAFLAMPVGEALADRLETVKERGTLIVGVRADYKPYGFLDPNGEIIGIEPTLAKDVADRLGVEVEFVPVVASNRMQFLEQGRIDLMIATMTDTEERRQVVNIVEPNYYSSGTNILVRKSAGITEWEELDGVPVCGIQGAFYNRKTEEEFGAEIVAFTGTAEVLTALQQGAAPPSSTTTASSPRGSARRNGRTWEMPLQTIDDAPWGLAVQHGEDNFYAFMAEVIADWHKSGIILELETEYGVENTPFALAMHEEFKDD